MLNSARRTALQVGIVLGAALLSGPSTAVAQKAAVPPARLEATRAELENIATHPPKGMSAADLSAVHNRLADGDFSVGDQINIQVAGEAALTGTFNVSPGRTLNLPSLTPLSLQGVLRSESDSVISEFIGKFLRNPQVTVQPLLRLGVLGGVAKPGYYQFPSTALISEVVMGAGGMAAAGKMSKTQVYRANSQVLDPKAVNTAITNGTTLDILNLQSGDNIQIGEKGSGIASTAGIITAVLAIPLMIVTISAFKPH